MGVFDGLLGSSFDDPKTLGLLQMAASLSSGQKFMPALSEGLLGRAQIMQQAKQQKGAEEMRALQMQRQQMELTQAQRQAEMQKQQDAFRNSIPSPQMAASQAALAGGGGPTMANAAAMPKVDPNAQFMHGAMRSGLMSPLEYMASMRKDRAPLITKAGDVARDAETGRELWRNEDKATTPADWQLYQLSGAASRGVPFESWVDARKKAGASSTSVSYGSPVSGLDAKGNPVFFQPSKDGGAPSIVQGVTPEKKEKPLTEGQAKAAAFASQMASAEKAFLGAGTDGSKLGDQVQTSIAQGAGNFVVSPSAQKARQAQEQWSEGYLRFKTGAATNGDEVGRNVRTYFPQPGDSAAVVAQKARMRAQAEQEVRMNAGGAQAQPAPPAQKQVTRTGTMNGRKVVQYADGTTAYAD